MIPTLVDEYTFEFIFDCIDKIKIKQPRIVELGSFLGGSIVRICNKCQEKSLNPIIFAIDNWECKNISHESKEWTGVYENFFESFEENTKDLPIFPLKMDALQAAETFTDDSIDLLFIDDNHQYPHTKNVLSLWLPKVKEGGYIIGHDYSTNGVKMAVSEILGNKIEICETASGYCYKKC